jgi:hypothetical protein
MVDGSGRSAQSTVTVTQQGVLGARSTQRHAAGEGGRAPLSVLFSARRLAIWRSRARTSSRCLLE